MGLRQALRRRFPTALVWAVFIGVVATPVLIAAASPLQAWRDVAYITGGMAGVIALSLLFAQPLLAAGYLPGLRRTVARRTHRWLGASLILCIAAHVGGLYISSPMDALDALLLVSPTPFSIYGVTAMWTIVLTGLLVAFRRRLPFSPALWLIIHNLLAVIVVIATVIHAVMIDGAMATWSKWIMCGLTIAAIAVAVVHLRLIGRLH